MPSEYNWDDNMFVTKKYLDGLKTLINFHAPPHIQGDPSILGESVRLPTLSRSGGLSDYKIVTAGTEKTESCGR